MLTWISPRPSSYINLISLYQHFKYLNFQKCWDKISDKNLPINGFKSRMLSDVPDEEKYWGHCTCLQHFPKTLEFWTLLETICILYFPLTKFYDPFWYPREDKPPISDNLPENKSVCFWLAYYLYIFSH